LALLLTSAALCGLAAISVRASVAAMQIAAPSDRRECAVRHLTGWGGGHCPPLQERP
jgi:hypothetical protein